MLFFTMKLVSSVKGLSCNWIYVLYCMYVLCCMWSVFYMYVCMFYAVCDHCLLYVAVEIMAGTANQKILLWVEEQMGCIFIYLLHYRILFSTNISHTSLFQPKKIKIILSSFWCRSLVGLNQSSQLVCLCVCVWNKSCPENIQFYRNQNFFLNILFMNYPRLKKYFSRCSWKLPPEQVYGRENLNTWKDEIYCIYLSAVLFFLFVLLFCVLNIPTFHCSAAPPWWLYIYFLSIWELQINHLVLSVCLAVFDIQDRLE